MTATWETEELEAICALYAADDKIGLIRWFAANRDYRDFSSAGEGSLSSELTSMVCTFEKAGEDDAAAQLTLSWLGGADSEQIAEQTECDVLAAWEAAGIDSAAREIRKQAVKNGRYSVACLYRKHGTIEGATVDFDDRELAVALLAIEGRDCGSSSYRFEIIDTQPEPTDEEDGESDE